MKEDKDIYFKKVLEENSGRIYRICCSYTPDEDDRTDLHQEIVINIWKNLDSFRGESAINTWIYRIAVNTCLLHIKKQKLSRERLEIIAEELRSAPEEIDTEGDLKKLYKCINDLPVVERMIITMVLEDLSYKEIAEVTGMTVSNTGVKINRLKKKLSKMMEEIQ